MQTDLGLNGHKTTLDPSTIGSMGVKALIQWVRKHNKWDLSPERVSYLTRTEIENLILRDILPADRAPTRQRTTAEILGELGAIIERPAVDEDAIRDLIREELEARSPREVRHVIENGAGVVHLEGSHHYRLPIALKMIGAGVDLIFWGPAGSGKTTLATTAAKALGVEYLLKSFSPSTQGYELIGYMSPAGHYVPGVLYAAMKEGKLLILDEFDAADPGVGLLVNAAIAAKEVTFPNLETVRAAAGFRVVACMNTRGTGATVEYCGRNALDAATLDRFAALLVDYDPALEAAMVGVQRDGVELDPEAGGIVSPEGWLAIVESKRRKVEERRLPCVISPRATKIGAALFAAGLGQRWVEQATIYKSLTDDQRATLED